MLLGLSQTFCHHSSSHGCWFTCELCAAGGVHSEEEPCSQQDGPAIRALFKDEPRPIIFVTIFLHILHATQVLQTATLVNAAAGGKHVKG